MRRRRPMTATASVPRTSSAVARILDVKLYVLYGLVLRKKIAPPPKLDTGDFAWLDENIDEAAEALTEMVKAHVKAHERAQCWQELRVKSKKILANKVNIDD